MDGLRFWKGHGTQNDFVLLVDPPAALELGASAVAALCDRRTGIGGDGLIRAVRADAHPESVAQSAGAQWFMDYRNGDGSTAQMCGNGIRVLAALLVQLGLVDLPEGGSVGIATRAGVKSVRREGGSFAVDLGGWRVVGGMDAALAGADVTVRAAGEDVAQPGLGLDLGNPHVVTALPDLRRLAAVDLTRAPVVSPVPPEGANVEFVVPHGEVPAVHGQVLAGHLTMRVHERGVGETRSCGTGAAAAALAARVWAGAGAPDAWTVDVPGGRLQVTVTGGDVAGPAVELLGPAALVASGVLDPGLTRALGVTAARPATV